MSRDYVDSDLLISEIERRAGLYDKTMPDYSDKTVKEKLWSEVFQIVIPEWELMDRKERADKGKEIKKKWKNMRDSFRKEINFQKSAAAGVGTKKRRRYVFFEQMLFLLPSLQERGSSGNVGSPRGDASSDDFDADMLEPSVYIQERTDAGGQRIAADGETDGDVKPAKRRKKLLKKISYEQKIINFLKKVKDDEVDEDRTFLLSLLPSLKQFSQDQKLSVKMELLETIRHNIVLMQEQRDSRSPENHPDIS